jgi:hypothetical protein
MIHSKQRPKKCIFRGATDLKLDIFVNHAQQLLKLTNGDIQKIDFDEVRPELL